MLVIVCCSSVLLTEHLFNEEEINQNFAPDLMKMLKSEQKLTSSLLISFFLVSETES